MPTLVELEARGALRPPLVPYRLGHNPVAGRFVGGLPVVVRPDAARRLSARP